jgi:acyl-CoA dehydrogenase
MDHLITEAATRLFARYTPAIVRATLRGEADPVWPDLEASGFLDLLVPESQGGAGLPLDDVLPLALAGGRRGVPAPVIATILVRGAMCGEAPAGAIAIAGRGGSDGESIFAADLPNTYRPGWILVADAASARLMPVERASLEGDGWRWPKTVAGVSVVSEVDWLAAGALTGVGMMAGALARVRDDSLRHARERVQFGRPIAGFQAIQQSISQLVEQAALAEAAAAFAFRARGMDALGLDPLRIGVAKTCCGSAAALGSAIGHAVHGAIGMAEEFDLHLFTAILQRGRMLYGSEAYWARVIGEKALLSGRTMLDFVQRDLN